jgi:regulator of nonsense transcripts 1
MSTVDFPVVIVDEATQCDVGEVLMPLVKGSRHLVLVGDHKQLGSICCEAVKKKNLHRSLFELFINASARLGQ